MRLGYLILLFLLSAIFVNALPQRVYIISLSYQDGTFKLLNLSVVDGFSSILEKPMQYTARVISFDGEELYRGGFEIPNTLYPPTGPPVSLDMVNLSLSLPYFKEGKTIELSREEENLLRIDISDYAIICGDSKCHIGENQANCPKDCALSAGSSPSYNSLSRWLIIGFLVLTLTLIIFYRRSRRQYWYL